MSYVNNMSYVYRLYKLHELCNSYEYFYESLKITCFLLLKNKWKNQVLKIKNSILESEKDFIELKDKESKEVKIKRELEELF